jgi:hypothetical protein
MESVKGHLLISIFFTAACCVLARAQDATVTAKALLDDSVSQS